MKVSFDNPYSIKGIEKFFIVRGILEKIDGNEISDRKDRETHDFVTKSSQYAGEHFQLNDEEFDMANLRLEDMDKIGGQETNKFVS